MGSRKFFSTISLLTITALLYAANTSAQTRRAHLEFEGGFSYNQLYWHVPQYAINTGSGFVGAPATTANRTHFQLLPAIRIGLDLPLRPFTPMSFEPFIGYHVTGGESAKRANGYQDRMSFSALAPGMFLNYRLFRYRFSLGIRYDIYATQYAYYHGALLSTNNNNASWQKSQINSYIKNHSWNAGFRIGHPVWHSINLEASVWYGLSNLAAQTLRELHATIRPVQFRLMLNYRL